MLTSLKYLQPILEINYLAGKSHHFLCVCVISLSVIEIYGLAETIIVWTTPAANAGEVIIIKPLDRPPAPSLCLFHEQQGYGSHHSDHFKDHAGVTS